MDTSVGNRLLWVALPLALLLIGCGNYRFTFEVADVINAWGADVTAEPLDVDVVCLTAKDAENHPDIIRGELRADEWFKARDEDSLRIADIEPKRIYALRDGEPGDKRDTLLGLPLRSFTSRRDGCRTTTVNVTHPQFLSGESAIAVYGRFGSQAGIAKTPPLVIQPPPWWNTDITIRVGRAGLELVESGK